MKIVVLKVLCALNFIFRPMHSSHIPPLHPSPSIRSNIGFFTSIEHNPVCTPPLKSYLPLLPHTSCRLWKCMHGLSPRETVLANTNQTPHVFHVLFLGSVLMCVIQNDNVHTEFERMFFGSILSAFVRIWGYIHICSLCVWKRQSSVLVFPLIIQKRNLTEWCMSHCLHGWLLNLTPTLYFHASSLFFFLFLWSLFKLMP